MEEMLFEVFYICSSGHHFVQWSQMVCAIFVGNFPGNNPIKFCWNPPSGYGDVIWIFSIFCSGLHFVQWSGRIWAILVQDLPRNNPSFVEILQVVMEAMLFEVFFSIFSSDRHFVQRRRAIWAILVEDLPKNYPSKFGWNRHSGYRGDVVWTFFLFLAMAAVLCSGAERFKKFGRGPPKKQSYQVWLKVA